jgi:hypothetical protein
MSDQPEEITVVDLTCKGCGSTMRPEKRENVVVTKLPGGGLMFSQNDEPFNYTCPFCQKSVAIWLPGAETKRAWNNPTNVTVAVGGDVKGNIVIGSNNQFRN